MGTLEVANFGELTLSAASPGSEVEVDGGGTDGNGLLKTNDFVPLMIGKGKVEGFVIELSGRGASSRSSLGGGGRNINLLIAPKILGGLRPLGSVGSSSSSSHMSCVLGPVMDTSTSIVPFATSLPSGIASNLIDFLGDTPPSTRVFEVERILGPGERAGEGPL